ncbi:MAG: hypothetical protein JXR77_04150, partial [Lentisphaeria bacterium]|nr:hypothetical protein [Lentisphaeria bacterium]
SRITAAELATWATSHHGSGYTNPPTARIRFDNVCLFSNRGADPEFEWKQPPGSAPADTYAVAFDDNPGTVPPEHATNTEPRARFEHTRPGTWHLHVRAHGAAGWGAPAHRRIVIEPWPEDASAGNGTGSPVGAASRAAQSPEASRPARATYSGVAPGSRDLLSRFPIPPQVD